MRAAMFSPWSDAERYAVVTCRSDPSTAIYCSGQGLGDLLSRAKPVTYVN